jgi:hypothetical protein
LLRKTIVTMKSAFGSFMHCLVPVRSAKSRWEDSYSGAGSLLQRSCLDIRHNATTFVKGIDCKPTTSLSASCSCSARRL